MTDIPKLATEPSDEENKLSQIAQELPQGTEAPEAMPYVISFARYKNKLCEIDDLGKNKSKRALSILKDIGTKVCSRADFQRYNIKNKGIANSSEYRKLYNGLAPDVEVRELFLQGTGRIFYFDIEPERMLYILAIKENHFETNKVRS